MSQLVDIVKQIDKLNLGKEKFKKQKNYPRKDKGYYIALVDRDNFVDDVSNKTSYMSVNVTKL